MTKLLFVAALLAGQLPTELPSTKFSSGQDVQPYFEGWIHNPDGTFDLVFGYFNRNWQEELAIPAGPDNSVEPGGADRGQPTYFLPRRQSWVYRVRVPRDFGKQVVTWTITANGKTQRAYGELLPVEEITERIIMTRGNLNPGDDDPNKPPVIAIAPVAAPAVNAPIALTATVTDDGLPKPRPPAVRRTTTAPNGTVQRQTNSVETARPRGLTVTFFQYGGPAKVTFESAATTIPVANGTAATKARFDAPGTYTLIATASDGQLSRKAVVTVTVAAESSGRAKP